MMSISAWPTPTVSTNTSSRPEASISSAVCSAASDRPPSAPRLAIERMNTPLSRKCSDRRMRSPRTAPPVNGDEGSIDSTATSRPAARRATVSAPISVHTTLLQLVWVILAYMIASTVLVMTAGRLSDLFGRKRAYVGGLLLFAAASLGAGFAGTGTELILWRILQGIGGAFLFANTA